MGFQSTTARSLKMFGIGGWELVLIVLIVLLLFGAKRLPEIARAMGKSINEFKKAKDELISSATNPPPLGEEKKDAEKQDSEPDCYKKPDSGDEKQNSGSGKPAN